jgi:hypothetical protein
MSVQQPTERAAHERDAVGRVRELLEVEARGAGEEGTAGCASSPAIASAITSSGVGVDT